MMNKDILSPLRKKFPEYTDPMIEAHYNYYQTCDPMYFLRLAAQFDLPAYRTEPSEEGKDLLEDNEYRFDQTKASFLRYIRYLAAERVIVLLVAGYPFGPAPKAFSEIKQSQLNETFVELSKGKVPGGFRMSRGGEKVNFSDWLGHMVFQGADVDADFLAGLERFIKCEAGRLTVRAAINAFKHGRAQAPIAGQPFQIYAEGSGEKKKILRDMTGALHWIGWFSRKSAQKVEQSVQYGFEETDSATDYKTIKVLACIERLLVDIRKMHLMNDQNIPIFFPDLDDNALTRPFQRLVLKSSVKWNLNQKVAK